MTTFLFGINGNNGLLLQLNLYLFDFPSLDLDMISSIVLAPFFESVRDQVLLVSHRLSFGHLHHIQLYTLVAESKWQEISSHHLKTVQFEKLHHQYEFL